jgi:TonB family protein
VDNKQRGKSSTFYDNGNPKAESEITEDGQRYSAFLSKEGHNLLGTGSAIIPVTDEPTPVASFQEVDDYKVIAQFYVDEAQDTIYGLSEKQAFYKTGMEGLMGDLRRNIKYPTSARRSGTEGTVYVIFKVTRHGRATDIKIVKGVSPECDEESLRVVNLLADNWSPAMHRGKPVATRFVLPVKYKLTGSPGRKK